MVLFSWKFSHVLLLQVPEICTALQLKVESSLMRAGGRPWGGLHLCRQMECA